MWIDETGCDREITSGYAMRGGHPVNHRLLHRGRRVSTIAALCTDGILSVECTLGTVDGDKFTMLGEFLICYSLMVPIQDLLPS